MKKILSFCGLTILETFVLAAMAVLLLNSCGRKDTTEKTVKVIPVKVMTIGLSDDSNHRNYVGTVEESFGLSLSFSGMGTVERVLVSEGQRVNKGQLLAELSSGTARNSYEVTQSTLRQAQDAYDRMKTLYDKGSLPEIKWIEVETGLEKAKAMEAIARQNLDDTKLQAPFSGIVAKRSIEEGSNVMPGVSAFKIVSIDEVNVKVSIPENEIGAIRVGQSATVKVAALGNKEYKGSIDKKGVEGNPISHTYDIKIRIKNPQGELMPGMVCKVFVAQDAADRKIIVPNKAVQVAPDGKHFVWLADGNVAKRRFVTIGSLSDYGIVVENGLSEGDQVIVEGVNKISEGMQVSTN